MTTCVLRFWLCAMLFALCYFLGIGWLTWKQLRKILEATEAHFITEAKRRFVKDLKVYLDYKIRQEEGIRNENNA